MKNQATKNKKPLLARLFRNWSFLTFINGIFLATLFYLYIESNYEQEIFADIVKKIKEKPDCCNSKDSFAIRALHVTYQLEQDRETVFGDEPQIGFKSKYLESPTNHLMTGQGSCGSYAAVLATICKRNNIQVRIAQMTVNGNDGAHIVDEVYTDHGWAACDPKFNQYFVTPSGHLASIKEVGSNWAYYSKQTKPDYRQEYNYELVHYTNWNKIPIVMPMVKKSLNFLLGKETADHISLRVYILYTYGVILYTVLFLYLPILFITLRKAWKLKLIGMRLRTLVPHREVVIEAA